MYDMNARMHEMVTVQYHLCRRLGPVEVLGPADCERLNPSSIRSNREVCSSNCLRSRSVL